MSQASFTLRGRNPDVLSCIANLSNDEVFTPPEFAGRMLDTVAKAWAVDNDGESIWANPEVTFLDPFTKSGVFLREIAKRLIEGLEAHIPDLQTRVDHILTRQVFGIGITELTAMLARRSLYCSKHANGRHSITRGFDSETGNVWFERGEHTWDAKKCIFCGAPRKIFERGDDYESHAYEFIHTDDVKSRIGELFGDDMQFDVVIGNPPYQMTGAAGGTSDASIYHLFVEQAQRLEPRYLSMVIPSRWLAGGRGLNEFRGAMLGKKQLQELVDFPDSKETFPGVEIKGGVCYFLWSGEHDGLCNVTVTRGGHATVSKRDLAEFDVFVRDPLSATILKKVLAKKEVSLTTVLSRDTPFGIASNFSGIRAKSRSDDIPIYYISKMKRKVGFVARETIKKNAAAIDTFKLLVPEAYNGGDAIPHQILGRPEMAPSPSVCTQSYLFLRLGEESEMASAQSYYATRLFRFLVSLRKITQHGLHSTYSWVPLQSWDRTWTDDELFSKYDLTQQEQEHVKAQIKIMEL
ncbi:Eco57I restriction-modification methylase domain-containing protein [Sulfitobacter sp. CW3]|uniref:Eco57I restriction-modification methylase domain-containing protein n=1 Tax=Sulfitobacter sp. CW3 TaxID=2861965 RepID=UPI001C5CDAF8|nr:Eco57I restriction-modification methylase domain-containing protein [Sulfitobacter sp. CW3]MBW4961554.1 Eco57I restriction-modification methylase domain-containing protein [Sulfitobacter sp. CW3]